MKSYLHGLHRAPTDEGASAATPTPAPEAESKVVHRPNMPRKDEDVASVAKIAAKEWGANPQLQLLWIKQPDFSQMVNAYASTLLSRKTTGADQPINVEQLRNLDKKIDSGISSLKIDIMQKFTKAGAPAQYARYGIEKKGDRGYLYPEDRHARLDALQMTLKAVIGDGTGGTDYGEAFWNSMLADYQSAMNANEATDGTVSVSVDAKNDLRKKVVAVMRALQLLLIANYPESYEALFRKWGWQKEKY